MPRRSSRPSIRQGTGWWPIIGLVLLLAADAALIWYAMDASRPSVVPASAAGSPAQLPVLPESTPTEVAPTPVPTPTAVAAVAPVSVVLAAFDDRVAYRAAMGACPTARGVVEVTTDGGATWAPAQLAEASAPAAIAVISEVEASVLAATVDDCDAVAFRTFVQGADWAPGPSFDSAWRLDGAEVVAPSGTRSAPCAAPAQVSAADAASAAVLCGDSTVATTADGGATWATTAPVPGAIALAMSAGDAGSGIRLLVAGQGDCVDGVQAGVLASGATSPGALGECVTTDAAPGASTIAVDSGGGLWLWTGAQVLRSSDGGATW